ncbi:hypothetical protein GCG54_00009100 [Colletotrichum gloeosporioides]|uniref:Uncharacterized protein n=1 Tax=Colletotrichum gloeosporioides TaxID=474922 RepID=A0A8H8WNL4_COLGL|nr:uncharacterized protein GCG54_00009100 [Colletotrichum gloeosporioides]KAF3797130.1 hypothetical protein GCG54_00009100 [Colletotrichum gloeosporioides]
MQELPEQISGNSSQSSAASSKKPPSLPAWALAATESSKHLSQPWKTHYGAEPDDPNFAAERDLVAHYDRKTKVCYSEGSMAA